MSNYQVAAATWTAIEQEVNRLLPSIENNAELTPDDVKEVKRLVALVENSIKTYNKELTSAYNQYKKLLNDKLAEIGYPTIGAYIVRKRNEQQAQVSAQLNEKVDTFTKIVEEALSKTALVKDALFAPLIARQMMALFPKINSGAADKSISDWEPIKKIVNELIADADTVMHPLYVQMPLTTNVAKTFGQYFTTGDRTLLQHLPEQLKADQEWLLERNIAQQLTSEDALFDMMKNIIDERTPETLQQVRQLISIWDRRAMFN